MREKTDGWEKKIKEHINEDKQEGRYKTSNTSKLIHATEEMYGTSNKKRKLAYFALTLPEGRLQFSSAVSTRFLSAENILKIL